MLVSIFKITNIQIKNIDIAYLIIEIYVETIKTDKKINSTEIHINFINLTL